MLVTGYIFAAVSDDISHPKIISSIIREKIQGSSEMLKLEIL